MYKKNIYIYSINDYLFTYDLNYVKIKVSLISAQKYNIKKTLS